MHQTIRTRCYIIRTNSNRVQAKRPISASLIISFRANRMLIILIRIIWVSFCLRKEVVAPACSMQLIFIIENRHMPPKAKYFYQLKSKKLPADSKMLSHKICKTAKSLMLKNRLGQMSKAIIFRVNMPIHCIKGSLIIQPTICSKK